MPSIAKRIRQARKEARLTHEAFAHAVGVGTRTPFRWESGQSTPHARHWPRIVEATGKPLEFFFSDVEDEDDATLREAERILAAANDLHDMATALMRRIEAQRREKEVA